MKTKVYLKKVMFSMLTALIMMGMTSNNAMGPHVANRGKRIDRN